MRNQDCIPLSIVRNGTKVKLAKIHAGKCLNSRLAAMGLIPGVEITVINNAHPGPFVVSVRDTRMILGRGAANKIMVS